MELLNELSNELALTFLVEKKFREKIESSDVPSLIGRIKDILQPISVEENGELRSVKSLRKTQH